MQVSCCTQFHVSPRRHFFPGTVSQLRRKLVFKERCVPRDVFYVILITYMHTLMLAPYCGDNEGVATFSPLAPLTMFSSFFLSPVEINGIDPACNLQLTFKVFKKNHFVSPFSVSVFQSMWARLVSRLAMPAGSCTVLNMASSPMARCPQTSLLEVEMTASARSSWRLVLENMCRGQSSLIWNQQLWVSSSIVSLFSFKCFNFSK